MLELLKNRRSIRKFTNEPVSQEDIGSLLKAALLAPSSMGKKPVECIVVRDKETIACLKTYKKHGTTPLETAPLALVVIADSQKSDVWVEDASIVSILIQLEAEKLGLGSTWIQLRRREGDGGPSEEAFRKELGIPERYGVLSVVAIGHKDEHKKPYADADLDFTKVHYETFG
ncbi:nitroreductase family protein [uncultured Bilophila sp.]|uniref:nitroreductase family protein n=1 Tax=uncultured Bilophila sp. TaxID=529385 RepID=UPI00280B0F94|nr:nitroreductase family protein [uncultured Bilophila sp.]